MLRDEDIVCFSTADWDTLLPTNKHHLMVRLAVQNRVLYVETLGTRGPRLERTDLKRLWRRVRRGLGSPRQQAKNLYLLSPLVIPSFTTPLAVFLNLVSFQRKLRRFLQKTGMRSPIVWVYNPYAVHFLRDMPRKLLLYHCVDDLSEVPGAEKSGLRDAEIRLLRECDLVFASSKSLAAHCSAYNEATIYMPNVADFEHFNQAASDGYPVAQEMQLLRRPIVLFSGNLAPHKVDFDLIEFLSRQNPQWTVVLIGPLWEGLPQKRADRLQGLPNIQLLGFVPYEKLPSYLKAADVLIIPYLLNEVTEKVFPIKFFEYLATGKPIVATALPSLSDYGQAVALCRTYETFAQAVGEAIQSDSEEKQKRRLDLARQNTWEHRLEEMSAAIMQRMK
jgi:glycosyltransferase involved in cell wall biosynthesis